MWKAVGAPLTPNPAIIPSRERPVPRTLSGMALETASLTNNTLNVLCPMQNRGLAAVVMAGKRLVSEKVKNN